MSELEPDLLDERMRRHFAGIDTAPGFEARLAARIAGATAPDLAALRARAARRRQRESDALRREAWMESAIAAALGFAAIALVWYHGPAVSQGVELAFDAVREPAVLTSLTVAALGVAAWLPLQRYLPR